MKKLKPTYKNSAYHFCYEGDLITPEQFWDKLTLAGEYKEDSPEISHPVYWGWFLTRNGAEDLTDSDREAVFNPRWLSRITCYAPSFYQWMAGYDLTFEAVKDRKGRTLWRCISGNYDHRPAYRKGIFSLDKFHYMDQGYKILFTEQEKADYIRQQVGDYKGRTNIIVFEMPFLDGKCYAVKVGEAEPKKRYRIIGTAEDFHGYEYQFSGGYDPSVEDEEDAAERLKPRNTWVTAWRVVKEG